MIRCSVPRGMTAFLAIWAGQLVSIVGSGLTGFALGVYVYQRTGAATQLGLALLAATLPNLLVSPVAGALVDRWDRRRVMLLSDTGAGVSTLVIWLLLSNGQLQVWHIYLANAINSLLGAFQRPAYMAASTLLVPREHYGRAAGLMQLAGSISQIISPVLAGFMIVAIQIEGVLLIDFVTYLFAMLTLARVRIPQPEATREGRAGRGSLLREATYGWVYLKERPGLMGMLILFAFINFALGFHGALFTPFILSFSSPDVLGSIISVGGIGTLIGSLLMSTWGGARRKIDSLMGAMFLFGLCLSLSGLWPNPLLIGGATFVFFVFLPIASGSSQAIWQAKVAPDVQGRVFATRFMLATAINPLAYLLAGPLADHVFEPWMAANGTLAARLGSVVGVGAGRGIGLMFVIMGLFISLATVIGYLNPRIRLVEDELPDHAIMTPEPASSAPAKEAPVPAPAG